MKAFRGTLVAALLLAVLVAVVLAVRPRDEGGEPGQPQLFSFEKHELVRVEVDRPDGDPVVLAEKDGQWVIEGTGWVAGRSMVNRIKHQIHDLTARATVVEDPELPELYGLGDNAIRVTLTMRDGRTIAFEAGDPNPSSVSYYIRPIPGDTIYTVKKAAVDYYSLTLDQFRERRFAGFDSKDATRIEATVRLPDGGERQLDIERTGEHEWWMHRPVDMAASEERVRRLLGRVSALKARDFVVVEDPDGPGLQRALEEYGLAPPRADITIRFASREPLHLLVGADAPSDNRYEELAYMWLEGDATIYVARRGLLEEFAEDPRELRNRRVVRLDPSDVVAIDAELRAEPGDDLQGSHGVRYAAEQWVWKDGVPVPGSTPSRVAKTLARLEVEEFVTDDPKDLSRYGLDDPVARVVLTARDGRERVVLIGGEGEPELLSDGAPRKRRYAMIEGSPSVYLVGEHLLRVVRDLVREGNRKAERDAERAARRERIPTVQEDEP